MCVAFPWEFVGVRELECEMCFNFCFCFPSLGSVSVLCVVDVRHLGAGAVSVRCLFVCLFVCLTLHSWCRAEWLLCAYAHLCHVVCLCLGLGCSVSCVEVAFIDVTSHVCVCVWCPRRCRLYSWLSRLSVCASCARAACIPTRAFLTTTLSR